MARYRNVSTSWYSLTRGVLRLNLWNCTDGQDLHVTPPYKVNIIANTRWKLPWSRAGLKHQLFKLTMQTKLLLSTLSWSGYIFYLCADVHWKTVRRWRRVAEIRKRGNKTNRHLIKKTLLRKKYKPWKIWQSGFLGNLQTNTN